MMWLWRNKAVARRFIAQLGDLTGQAILTMMPPEGVFEAMLCSRGLPLKKRLTRDEFCELQRTLSQAFPNGVRHEVKGMIAEGDRVAVETECFGDLPGGGVYNNRFHFLIRVRKGKIVSVREYTDFLHTKESLFP